MSVDEQSYLATCQIFITDAGAGSVGLEDPYDCRRRNARKKIVMVTFQIRLRSSIIRLITWVSTH